MLVLSRRLSEQVLIGNNVVVTVVEISCNRVRLGIEAPEHIAVDRPEVREKQSREADSWRHRMPRHGQPGRKDNAAGHPIRRRA